MGSILRLLLSALLLLPIRQNNDDISNIRQPDSKRTIDQKYAMALLLASRPLTSPTRISRSITRDTDNRWRGRAILETMRTGSLPNVELVAIPLLVHKVIVVGVVAVDRQLVLERRVPLRVLKLVPGDARFVLDIWGWRAGAADGPVDGYI